MYNHNYACVNHPFVVDYIPVLRSDVVLPWTAEQSLK